MRTKFQIELDSAYRGTRLTVYSPRKYYGKFLVLLQAIKDRKRYAHTTNQAVDEQSYSGNDVAVLSAFDVDDDAACTCIVVR